MSNKKFRIVERITYGYKRYYIQVRFLFIWFDAVNEYYTNYYTDLETAKDNLHHFRNNEKIKDKVIWP